jgi:hypothetical protein
VMSTPFWQTKDGHEYQLGVNHLSHFLLFKRLLPLLLKSSTPSFQSRVVNVSSAGHHYSTVQVDDLDWKKRQYHPMQAYGQSKTANIWMANGKCCLPLACEWNLTFLFITEIERRYGNQGLHAFSLHPGTIFTNLSRYSPFEDLVKHGIFSPEGVTSFVHLCAFAHCFHSGELLVKEFKLKRPSQGAATTVWAAIGKDLEGKGGLYLEDAQIATASVPPAITGYDTHAYDVEGAKKLWEYSEKIVNA